MARAKNRIASILEVSVLMLLAGCRDGSSDASSLSSSEIIQSKRRCHRSEFTSEYFQNS